MWKGFYLNQEPFIFICSNDKGHLEIYLLSRYMLDVILRLVGDYLLIMFSMQELLTVTPLFYFIFLGQRLITFNDSTFQCKDWSTIGIHLVPVAFLQQFKRFLRQEWVVDKSTIHCNFVLRWDWEIESAVSCIVDTAIGANSNFLILHIYSCTTTH